MKSISTTHGLPVFVGVLDLVRAGGVIVDVKTTGRSPDPEMVRHTTEVQTTGYALLLTAKPPGTRRAESNSITW